MNMLLSKLRTFCVHAMAFIASVLTIACIWLKVDKTEISVYQIRGDERLKFEDNVRSSRERVFCNHVDHQRSSPESTKTPIIKGSTPEIEYSIKGKRFIFIGYREHWPFHPPFDCDCQNHFISVEKINSNGDFSNTTFADSLIFVIPNKGKVSEMSWQMLRKNRGPNQRWVFASRESALTTQELMPIDEKFRNNTYHLSFSYHSESDFHMPYGMYVPRSTPDMNFDETISRILGEKKHLISWMSSTCRSGRKKKRASFAKSLSNIIPLHRYGQCGNMTCEKNSRNCEKKLMTYKFALILENSCCSEYITEKFWNALFFEQVPVVLGAQKEDYVKIAPPNSYIHMENFSNVHDLADYLNTLDNDDALYQRYHSWRQDGDISRAKLPRDFVSSCYSLCMIGSKLYALDETNDNSYHFDPYCPWWYGSCRECDSLAQSMLRRW